ncbi:hypothetical protein D6D23_10593 [Aureobasidium pullulans]|nr:hypothetical protein D6D23_10593 [Aureobasidium pullulans]
MSLGWLANTDITPRTSLQAVLNYLSEYCTKAGFLTAKLMNKLIVERDYSNHEIAHMLFSPPLVDISRIVILVDCKFALQQNQSFSVGGRESVAGRNVIQKYMENDHVYHNVSYHQVLTRSGIRGKKIRHIARNYEDFCRVKLILHRPLRSTVVSQPSVNYDHYEDQYDVNMNPAEEGGFEDDLQDEPEEGRSWQDLAANRAEINKEDPDARGQRDIDR